MPLRDRVRQCDAMPPGVKCARSIMLSLSLSLSGEQKTSPPLVHQRYNKLVSEERCRLLPPMSSSPPISPPPHSLSHTPERSRSSLSLEPGPARLILRVLYLGEKSMSTDMLTRVQTLRARELARKEARREPGRRLGSRVTGMQCRISPCSSERAKGDRAEKNAHLEMQRRRAYTYMRIHTRHARPAVS